MTKKILLAGFFILMVLAACTRPYPQASVAVTPSATGLFGNQVSGAGTMEALQATGVAQLTAQVASPTPDFNTTGTVTVNGTEITPNTQITFTPTTLFGDLTTPATPTTPVPAGSGTPVPTTAVAPTTIVSRPASYTLQQNEFVYCIARRFDVDPNDILSLNGLVDSETVYPGTVLRIPQSGSFPGDRSLRSHPASYTVTGNSDTNIYGVACIFGDADPARIAQANNLPLSALLSIGQVVQVP